MKSLGRLACLLAVFGLMGQLAASSMALWEEFGHQSAAVSHCGDCPESSEHSSCPSDPLHDHCGPACAHFFTAISDTAEAFHVWNFREIRLLSCGQEAARDGFPTGLFIPPKAS